LRHFGGMVRIGLAVLDDDLIGALRAAIVEMAAHLGLYLVEHEGHVLAEEGERAGLRHDEADLDRARRGESYSLARGSHKAARGEIFEDAAPADPRFGNHFFLPEKALWRALNSSGLDLAKLFDPKLSYGFERESRALSGSTSGVP
jgi:hypothetical protein